MGEEGGGEERKGQGKLEGVGKLVGEEGGKGSWWGRKGVGKLVREKGGGEAGGGERGWGNW